MINKLITIKIKYMEIIQVLLLKLIVNKFKYM